MFVKNTCEGCLIVKINTKNDSILIVCIYNPPKGSPYRWCKQKFEDLTQTLKFLEKKAKPKSIIITGDLNFSTTDWKQMSSPDELDNTWLNYFVDENFEQMLNFTDLLGFKKQLDVFLTNEPQFWINSKIETKISNNYALNNKKCSDHYAYITRYECNYDQANDRSRPKYAYKRIDCIKFNGNISKNPFNPYCYSNVDELLKQWYEWFNRLFDQNVPRVTQHRSQLPPWVSKSTSHEMKKLSTLKRKAIAHPSPAPSTLNKMDCLEEKVNTLCKNDQVIYESEIFATRQFSVIQKYLRSIKKVTLFPSEMHLNEQTANTNEEKAELFKSVSRVLSVQKNQMLRTSSEIFQKKKLKVY